MSDPTLIRPGSHVTLELTIFDSAGNELEATDPDEPLVYLHGYGQMVPGLERALEGLSAGVTKDVSVGVEDAYGPRDDEAFLELDRGDFPDPDAIKIGDDLDLEADDGEVIAARVAKIDGNTVIADANHPLAGLDLRFGVKILTVRDATPDEIEMAEAELADAHVHGEGCDHDHGDGHHHHHGRHHQHGPDCQHHHDGHDVSALLGPDGKPLAKA